MIVTASELGAGKVTVNTKLGPIIGEVGRVGRAFSQIKYANHKRWENPTPVEPWSAPLDATKPMTISCSQICQLPKETCAPPEAMKEDCLYLNIFTPLNPTGARLPVLIWYHGGRYQQGYAGGDLYWGDELASPNAIVVAVNYRLGALGYMYNAANNISGNFGLKDQIMALQFVKYIISDFGGNPDLITISGQSAGAGSVAAILSAPSTHGLYQNAIMFSNPFSIPMRDVKSQEGFATAFLKNTTCADRACLDALSIDTIMSAQKNASLDAGAIIAGGVLSTFLPYTPTVGSPDGLLPIQPFTAFSEGKIPQDVSIILGTTSDEAIMFIYGAMENPVKKDAYGATLFAIFGFDRGPKVLKRFPNDDPDKDYRPQMVEMGNEFIFENVNNHVALAVIASRKNVEDKYKVYSYRFSHVFEDPTIWDHLQDLCGKKSCHAAELPILFRNNKIFNRIGYSHAEMRFTSELKKQLYNFIWTGNPNKGPVRALPWASYYSGKNRIHWECDKFEMLDFPVESQQFWDDVGYGF